MEQIQYLISTFGKVKRQFDKFLLKAESPTEPTEKKTITSKRTICSNKNSFVESPGNGNDVSDGVE